MAKAKKPKEVIAQSDELIAQAITEGQALIAEGKTKVQAVIHPLLEGKRSFHIAVDRSSVWMEGRSFHRAALL